MQKKYFQEYKQANKRIEEDLKLKTDKVKKELEEKEKEEEENKEQSSNKNINITNSKNIIPTLQKIQLTNKKTKY